MTQIIIWKNTKRKRHTTPNHESRQTPSRLLRGSCADKDIVAETKEIRQREQVMVEQRCILKEAPTKTSSRHRIKTVTLERCIKEGPESDRRRNGRKGRRRRATNVIWIVRVYGFVEALRQRKRLEKEL